MEPRLTQIGLPNRLTQFLTVDHQQIGLPESLTQPPRLPNGLAPAVPVA